MFFLFISSSNGRHFIIVLQFGQHIWFLWYIYTDTVQQNSIEINVSWTGWLSSCNCCKHRRSAHFYPNHALHGQVKCRAEKITITSALWELLFVNSSWCCHVTVSFDFTVFFFFFLCFKRNGRTSFRFSTEDTQHTGRYQNI